MGVNSQGGRFNLAVLIPFCMGGGGVKTLGRICSVYGHPPTVQNSFNAKRNCHLKISASGKAMRWVGLETPNPLSQGWMGHWENARASHFPIQPKLPSVSGQTTPICWRHPSKITSKSYTKKNIQKNPTGATPGIIPQICAEDPWFWFVIARDCSGLFRIIRATKKASGFLTFHKTAYISQLCAILLYAAGFCENLLSFAEFPPKMCV